MTLNPLLITYRDLVPILDTFTRQYQTGALAPSVRQIQYHTVEEAVQLISQALVAMGDHDPHLTSQGELDIWL